MYPVEKIAEYVIDYGHKRKISVTNLKLQKLLYFVQAVFLVKTGQPCFPEDIEAWKLGPVVPEVYFKYKSFGNLNIFPSNKKEYEILPQDQEMINGVMEACADMSASDLVDLTHRQSPWKNAYSAFERRKISNESIASFFSD